MSETLELLSPSTNPNALQTRESFPVVKDQTLGTVQVADELGFAYLDGDIDFGATGKHEIFQNIKYIILTEYFSTPLDREFGMNYSMVDKPMAVAEAILAQEVAMKISLYEPRAQFREISFVRDEMVGKLSPSVVVVLLTTDEGPSLYRTITGVSAGAAALVPVPVSVSIATPETFSGTITGLPGAQGPAGTVVVGTTTTGAPGTDALVVNSGTPSSAVLDFTIPEGEKGDQGTGITIKGTVANHASLPTTGNQPGDMWIASDTGHGWAWNGTAWVDCGPIQGPIGPVGPQGPQGSTGNTGATGTAATVTAGSTITGAAGTSANVVNVGSSSAAIFNFTIPQGIQGVQGIQGNQGIQGIQGPTGAPATVTVGTTTTGVAGSPANVTNTGTASAAILNFTIPQGIQGVQGIQGIQGATGATGPANVLTVSGTTTGAPGSNASVSISGTSPAQSLAFTIPTGAQGPTGPTGSTGPPGTGQIWRGTWNASTNYVLNDAVEYQGSTYLAIGPNINEPPTPASSNWIPPLANTAIRGSIAPLPSANQTDYYARGDNTWQLIKPVVWGVRGSNFNALGNANFEVDQRNTFAGYSNMGNGYGFTDRWFMGKTGSYIVSGGAQEGAVAVPPGGVGDLCITHKYLRATVTTAQASLAAGDYCVISQSVEGPIFRRLYNTQHSISLLARSSVAGLKFTVRLGDSATPTTSICFLCTMGAANTWTLITLPNIPAFPAIGAGGNTFTFDSGSVGYTLMITLACGSTYSTTTAGAWVAGNKISVTGQDNFVGTSGRTFDLAFVQHQPGSECTSLIDLPFEQNLDSCQRYFQKTWDYATPIGTATNAGCHVVPIQQGWGTVVNGGRFVKRMAKTPLSVIPYNTVQGNSMGCRGYVGGANYTCTLLNIGESGWSQMNISPGVIANDFWALFHYYADTQM